MSGIVDRAAKAAARRRLTAVPVRVLCVFCGRPGSASPAAKTCASCYEWGRLLDKMTAMQGREQMAARAAARGRPDVH